MVVRWGLEDPVLLAEDQMSVDRDASPFVAGPGRKSELMTGGLNHRSSRAILLVKIFSTNADTKVYPKTKIREFKKSEAVEVKNLMTGNLTPNMPRKIQSK